MASQLDFSGALGCIKAGAKVARAGWNGKGMFLFLISCDDYDFDLDAGNAVLRELALALDQEAPDNGAWICMKTADNCLVPWLASQTDILANDWTTVS